MKASALVMLLAATCCLAKAPPEPKEIAKQQMKHFDRDGSGELEPREFISLIMSGNPEAAKGDKDELVTLYQTVNADQSGGVSEKEMEAYMQTEMDKVNKQRQEYEGKARQEYMEKQHEMLKKANADESKLLAEQAMLDGGWFTFGSFEYEDERFQKMMKQHAEDKRKNDDLKESVGSETWDLINEQLLQRGKKGMTSDSPKTRDGGAEADVARVRPFAMDKTCVTIDAFRRFVRDTKYKTEADVYGWSFVLEYLASGRTIAKVDDKEKGLGRVKESPWWMAVEKATWRRPEGPDSTIKNRGTEPVVHVSWNDARAYCKWAGRRLPSEKEWEYAARGGQEDAIYPWGDDPDGGKCNGWEGDFPKENTEEDGFAGPAPVDSYEPNGHGVYNMVGNVWEWVDGGTNEKRVLRGGSFVDSMDGRINHALRVSTRMENSADSGSHNTGFRCAMSLGKPSKPKKRGAAKLADKAKGKKGKKEKFVTRRSEL